MLNRKGATAFATLFLVVIALALIGFSLFSFVTERPKVEAGFEEVKVLSEVNDEFLNIDFYFYTLNEATLKDLDGVNEEKFIAEFEEKDMKNYFSDYIKEGKYEFSFEAGKLVFVIKDYEVGDVGEEEGVGGGVGYVGVGSVEGEKVGVRYVNDLKFEKQILDKQLN